MSSGDKASQSLSIDRAAFLLLRVKKAFRKKKQQRKEKRQVPSRFSFYLLLPSPLFREKIYDGKTNRSAGTNRKGAGERNPILREILSAR